MVAWIKRRNVSNVSKQEGCQMDASIISATRIYKNTGWCVEIRDEEDSDCVVCAEVWCVPWGPVALLVSPVTLCVQRGLPTSEMINDHQFELCFSFAANTIIVYLTGVNISLHTMCCVCCEAKEVSEGGEPLSPYMI